MPRCQRTFYRLREGGRAAESGATRWVCPHCPDAEMYETVQGGDLQGYADLAYAFCADGFGPPRDAHRPTLLLLGLHPECAYEPEERRYDIYLQRGSDPWQQRLQIGHEMFHRTCSWGRVFHWSHEMLACMVSVRLLHRHGLPEYARIIEQNWLRDADKLSLAAMQATDLWATSCYPPGFYGRAYAVGVALTEAVGWDRLRPLARRFCPYGAPDVDGWLAGLPPAVRARARAVLSGTGGPGVQ